MLLWKCNRSLHIHMYVSMCHLHQQASALTHRHVHHQEVKTAEKAEPAEGAAAEAQASPEPEEEEPALVEAKDEEGNTLKNEKGETIYLGFEKGDYAPRDGRKGRTIVDDAERYPALFRSLKRHAAVQVAA